MSDSNSSLSESRTDLPSSDGQALPAQLGKDRDTGDFGETLAPTLTPTVGSSVVESPSSRSIAGYELLEELGRGGMGVVYKARQKGLQRLVALKMILQAEHAGPDDRARFQREATALGNLRHENIVQVYEVGEHEGKPFFSLEYVEGGSLDRLLRSGPLKQQEAAALVEKLAYAMQTAHEAGIIHRDLKPANVLLAACGLAPTAKAQAAIPKITDFGLAKKLDDVSLSASGAIMGTPSYMAPEQAAGKVKAMDGRTDVYALGAILYECLTGRPPFRAATVMDTLIQVIGEEPVAVRSLQPNVHPDLETICHKCLQKEEGRRYTSAHALADELGRFQRGEPVSARPVGRLERGWRWCKRDPKTASLLAAVAILLIVGTTVSTILAIAEGEARRQADENAGRETTARIKAQTAEESEKQERIKAQSAEQQEKIARDLAEKEEKRAKEQLYVNRLAFVQSYWKEGNARGARVTLEELQEHRDHWEHRYLTDLVNHRGQRSFPVGQEWITCMALSKEGNRLVWGNSKRAKEPCDVQVLDAVDGKLLHTLKGHTAKVGCVAISAEGKQVASGSYDNTVKVWDTGRGSLLHTLNTDAKPVFGIAISPDGKSLVAVASERTLYGWDLTTGKRLFTFQNQTGIGESVCFSPDGKRFATGGTDRNQEGEVRLWDAANGESLSTVKVVGGYVKSVGFHPDGTRLVVTCSDRAIRVLDVATRRELLAIKGHPNEVTTATYSPDGKRIASVSWDNTVRVWDAATGRELLMLRGHKGPPCNVAFYPEGDRLVSAAAFDPFLLWDGINGQEVRTIKDDTISSYHMDVSPDGKRVATGTYRAVSVYDTETGELVQSLKGIKGQLSKVAFSPDGACILSAGGVFGKSGEVKLWDVATGKERLDFKGHEGNVIGAAFSADGTRIAAVGDKEDKSGWGKVWDAATGRELFALPTQKTFFRLVCFSPDGKRLATGTLDSTIKVWDAATGQEVRSIRRDDGRTDIISDLLYSPDGKRLACAYQGKSDQRGEVILFDAATGEEQLALKGHPGNLYCMAFHPDGKRIVTGGGEVVKPGEVKLWDAMTGQELLTFREHASKVLSVAFSRDGTLLVTGGGDSALKLMEARKGQEALILRGHSSKVSATWFRADGKQLASVSYDDTIKLWDPATGRNLQTILLPNTYIRCGVFSPDGKKMAWGNSQVAEASEVILYDLEKKKELFNLKGHTNYVRCVAFSPDGKHLASGSGDKTVKMWDVAEGREQFTFKRHTKWVMSVAFSPDGKRIASGGMDKTIRMIDAKTGEELRVLKGHRSSVLHVSFTEDGKRLVSREEKDRRIVWDLTTGVVITDEEETTPTNLLSPDGTYLAVPMGDAIQLQPVRATVTKDAIGPRWWDRRNDAWHQEQAEDSIRRGDGYGAAFHLERVLAVWPWDAALHVQMGHTTSRLGREEESARHFLQAILLDPGIRLWPKDLLAASRALQFARVGDWKRAIPDLEMAAHQQYAKLSAWYDLLLARHALKSGEGKDALRELLDRFEKDAAIRNQVVYSGIGVQCEVAEGMRLLKLSEQRLALKRDASSLGSHGAALYRVGRYEEAIPILQEAIKEHGKGGFVDTWLFLAMAQQRLRKETEARSSFTRFEAWYKGRTFATWQETVRWRSLYDEARNLILMMPQALGKE